MNIAILGWGSLIWDPRDLNFDGRWRENGPRLPIEFARISSGGRLTLTITPGRPLVPVLWTMSTEHTLAAARENLARREGSSVSQIGVWRPGGQPIEAQREQALIASQLERWWEREGKSLPIDAVIWTDLGPHFQTATRRDFHFLNALNFLKGLNDAEWAAASEYILRTPAQVATAMRPGLETFVRERNLTAGFTKPLLGPRADLAPVRIDDLPQYGTEDGEEFSREAMLPVWVNGRAGWVWFYHRNFGSTRFEVLFDAPFPRAEAVEAPDGRTLWMFGTKYYMGFPPYEIEAAEMSFRFHHRDAERLA